MSSLTLKPVHHGEARKLISDGALLIDIREMDEHARERIPGGKHLPLSQVQKGAKAPQGSPVVIYYCRSGYRTVANEGLLSAAAAGCDAYVLEGGIEAWRDAGLETERQPSTVIEISRQVQIVAGLMALTGVILGTFFNPWFYLLDLLVGSGLTFAGITGTCPMALLLERLPWNARFRPRANPARHAA